MVVRQEDQARLESRTALNGSSGAAACEPRFVSLIGLAAVGLRDGNRRRPLCAASSTDRCNTFCELLSRRLIEQGLSRPFIELPCDSTELGLAVQGQIGATRKILAQQSVGVFV